MAYCVYYADFSKTTRGKRTKKERKIKRKIRRKTRKVERRAKRKTYVLVFFNVPFAYFIMKYSRTCFEMDIISFSRRNEAD